MAILGVCAGGSQAQSVFEPTLSYEEIASVGAADEVNDLFVYGQPLPRLVDSTTVAFTDGRMRGAVTVADIITGEGWSLLPGGADARGPGEFGVDEVMVYPVGDTIKFLTTGRRLSARSRQGDLLFDSTYVTFGDLEDRNRFLRGLAGNSAVTYWQRWLSTTPVRVAEVETGFGISRIDGTHIDVVVDTIQSDRPGRGTLEHNHSVVARGDLIVYSRDNEVATFDHRGRPIAMTKLPWRVVFFPRIDASGRVWVQVRGGNRDGYNLVLFDRRLRKLGTAVIRRFRDAFGDYVLSARPDELGVESLVLSRATR